MLLKNGYLNPFIDKVFKTENSRLNYINPYFPEKFLALIILPYASKKLTQIKKKMNILKEKVYHAAKPRVICISSSVLRPKDKYLISNKHKSCVVYTFECLCSNSYIGQTLRHFETRIKFQSV